MQASENPSSLLPRTTISMEAKRVPRRLPAVHSAPPLYEVRDSSWTTFAACAVIVVALAGAGFAFLQWKDAPIPPDLTQASLETAPTPAVAPSVRPRAMRYEPPPLPTADSPITWNDLTLMLRTGLHDDEIITAMIGKQLVCQIGPAQASILLQLGAGYQLLRYLQSRQVYAPVPVAERVVVTAPALPAPVHVAPAATPAPPPPVDYAAKDREIPSLKTRIDALDDQMRCIRTNPDRNPYRPYYRIGTSGSDYRPTLEEYLDRVDQQRNDLRRQKWQLEGR